LARSNAALLALRERVGLPANELGLGLRLDDAAKVAQDRPQRALDPATGAIALAEGGLKRVYES